MKNKITNSSCRRISHTLLVAGFLIATILSTSAFCVTPAYFKTKIISGGDDFSFPVFSKTKGDKATTRINQFLQLTELYFVSERPVSAHIFHQAKANDGSIYGGKVSIAPSIYSNNRRVLSLGFYEASSGATTHYWRQYYTFNSGNGDRIELRDLFTPEGYNAFKDIVLERRSAKYRKEVEKKVESDDRETFLTVLGSFEYDEFSDFYIQQQAIVIDGWNMLGKSLIFNDLDMTTRLPLPVFRKYLNDYGRAVFGISRGNTSKFRSKQLPQLFSGTVDGTYPVVMVLRDDGDDSFGAYHGLYAYLRYGDALMIAGNDNNDQIDLTERLLSPKIINNELGPHRRIQDNGYISGKLSGLTFSGTWTDLSRSKYLSFYASAN